MKPPVIVFTDLDGTLLDHETYSFAPAEPALAKLRNNGIPLILASSKTAAEIAGLRGRIGFPDCPSIIENGAGILEPHDPGNGDDTIHARLIAMMNGLPARLRDRFSGFSGRSVADIAADTGLSPEDAAKAAQRRFSEPGLWKGTDAERAEFETMLSEKGITARQGGRYLTLSFGRSKADRMAEIAARYAGNGDRPRVVALGDAPNDIEMIQAADIGVIVANPNSVGVPELGGEAAGRIIRTTNTGPAGWNDAVLRIIEDMRD